MSHGYSLRERGRCDYFKSYLSELYMRRLNSTSVDEIHVWRVQCRWVKFWIEIELLDEVLIIDDRYIPTIWINIGLIVPRLIIKANFPLCWTLKLGKIIEMFEEPSLILCFSDMRHIKEWNQNRMPNGWRLRTILQTQTKTKKTIESLSIDLVHIVKSKMKCHDLIL